MAVRQTLARRAPHAAILRNLAQWKPATQTRKPERTWRQRGALRAMSQGHTGHGFGIAQEPSPSPRSHPVRHRQTTLLHPGSYWHTQVRRIQSRFGVSLQSPKSRLHALPRAVAQAGLGDAAAAHLLPCQCRACALALRVRRCQIRHITSVPPKQFEAAARMLASRTTMRTAAPTATARARVPAGLRLPVTAARPAVAVRALDDTNFAVSLLSSAAAASVVAGVTLATREDRDAELERLQNVRA